MSWFRIGNPGEDTIAHINFGRRKGRPGRPASCVAPRFAEDKPDWGDRCGRMSIALCDAPAGHDLAGKPTTCDAPMCELHRRKGGTDVDYCPRHQHLAPTPLTLESARP